MHPVIHKTLGGLSTQYYFRNFFFGALLLIFILYMMSQSPAPMHLSIVVMMVVNTLLYPYARFVYESVMNFIMGENVFFVNIFLMMFAKVITILLCWGFALFIAPLGLAYLYFYHSKAQS